VTALPEGARVCARTGLVLMPAKGETGWRLAKTSYGPLNPPARPADPDADPAAWGRFDIRGGRTSDASDVYLLTWCTDGHRPRALSRESDATRVLRTLSRPRKQLVEAQVPLVNQRAQNSSGFSTSPSVFSPGRTPTSRSRSCAAIPPSKPQPG